MNALIHVYIPTVRTSFEDLRSCLHALAGQTLPVDRFQCSIVLSGASEFHGESRVRELLPDAQFLPVAQVGLVNARDAALRSSKAPLICSVDDDNVLHKDYLRHAVDFMQQHPEVGMLGGKIVPQFETSPPGHFRKHDGVLALRDFGDTALISSEGRERRFWCPGVAPIGAGMVIRAEVAEAFIDLRDRGGGLEDGRVGDRVMAGCEDTVIVMEGIKLGYEAAYDPRMVLTHLIPARRVQREAFHTAAYIGAVGWARFRVDHGMLTAVPAWTVPLRKLRAWFVHRAWTEEGRLDWLMSCGTFEGMKRRGSRW